MFDKRKKIMEDIVPPDQRRSIRSVSLPQRGAPIEKNVPPASHPRPISNPSSLEREARIMQAAVNKEQKTKISTEVPHPAGAPVQKSSGTAEHAQRQAQISSSGGDSPPKIPVMGTPGENRRFKKIFGPTFLVLLFALVLYSAYLFLHIEATVVITPREKVAAVSQKFTAKKMPRENELQFDVMTLSQENTKTVPSTGEKNVERRASGKVVIYNNYNATSQRLIKNTRLETKSGLVFRLDSSVVVPGQTKKDGQTIPGSIEANVTADAPGDSYNIPLSDFTIPGFKDDPRYNAFYGRSKTEMTGGFTGKIKVASVSDISAAKLDLENSIKADLLKKAKEQVPAGFILFDNAAYITTEDASLPESTDVTLKATLHAIIFDRNKLAAKIATVGIPEFYEIGEAVSSPNIDKLAFAPDSLEVSPWDTGNMPFTLSGTTTILWIVPQEEVKSDLVGIPKTRVNEIFSKYHSIENARVELQPPWKSALPEEVDRIKLTIEE